MTDYSHVILLESMTSSSQVIHELKQLCNKLAATQLGCLTTFNDVYLLLTQHLQLASRRGAFNDPLAIEQLTVAFAEYYFRALNQFADTGQLPAAWQLVLERQHNAKSIDLLLAANTHINHDLGLALSQSRLTVSRQDYFAIDAIFRAALPDILSSYQEQTVGARLVKSFFGRVMFRIIIHWRHNAWNKYRHTDQASLEQATARNAHRIQLLAL